MASRKNTNQFIFFSDADMSGNLESPFTNVEYMDNVGILATWAGTAEVGEIFVEVSNDMSQGGSEWEPTNWVPLDFGSQILVTGDDEAVININQVPFKWLRMRYERDSGTGLLNASMYVKMV